MADLKVEELTMCAGCDGELVGNIATGKTGNFIRLVIHNYFPDVQSIRERMALTDYFASAGGERGQAAGIADVFSQPQVAKEIGEPTVANCCFICYTTMTPAAISERVRAKQEADDTREDDGEVREQD